MSQLLTKNRQIHEHHIASHPSRIERPLLAPEADVLEWIRSYSAPDTAAALVYHSHHDGGGHPNRNVTNPTIRITRCPAWLHELSPSSPGIANKKPAQDSQ